MINNRIFDIVLDFTINKFGKDYSDIQLVYGFAKLASLEPSYISHLLDNEDDRAEFLQISKLFIDKKLPVDALIKAIPILTAENKGTEFAGVIERIKAEEVNFTAFNILDSILSEDNPALALIKNGADFDEICDFTGEVSTEDANQKADTDKLNKFQKVVNQTNKLTEALSSYVMEQDEAISDFTRVYFKNSVVKDSEKNAKAPLASYVFAGATGVGKSLFIDIAAKVLNMKLNVFDVRKYPRGAERALSEAAEYVSTNPKSIFVFENYDFADVFMDRASQIISGDVQIADFSNSIFIFVTTSIGVLGSSRSKVRIARTPKLEVVSGLSLTYNGKKDSVKEDFYKAVGKENILLFNYLSFNALKEIAKKELESICASFKEQNGYELEFDENMLPLFLFNQGERMNGKNIYNNLSNFLRKEFFEFGRHITNAKDDLSMLKKISMKVQLPEDEKLLSLFQNSSSHRVLFLGKENDLANIPFSSSIIVDCVSSKDEAIEKLLVEEYSFALIDPLYRVEIDSSDFLSLDDKQSEGIEAFFAIKSKLQNFAIFFLDNKNISINEEIAFAELGVEDFIELKDKVEFARKIEETCKNLYTQNKLIDISTNLRFLDFNTSQRITDDGKTAEITFYDFKLHLSVDPNESKALSENKIPKDRFKDVIGAKKAITDLEYFADRLKNPRKYLLKGAKPPKGVILYGPPGTGKTMLARAMAGECQIPFFAASSTEFASKYNGESEENIRKLFHAARDVAPSIIFIDEIDTIAKPRTGSEFNHSAEEMLNVLLVEIDGFEADPLRPVFVICATNFGVGSKDDPADRGKLDEAFVRRFDNTIYVDLPKEEERAQYLRILLKNYDSDEFKSAIETFANRATGLSCAKIQIIINGLLRKLDQENLVLTPSMLLDALDEYNYGESREHTPEYYHTTAIHESSHAFLCYKSKIRVPEFITIVSRGDYGGYTAHSADESVGSLTKRDLLNLINISLAGRCAEIEFFGEDEGTNTGYGDDIKKATKLAMHVICSFGMEKDIQYYLTPEEVLHSPLAEKFLERVNDCLTAQIEETKQIVRENKDKISNLAAFVEKNSQATKEEILSFFE